MKQKDRVSIHSMKAEELSKQILANQTKLTEVLLARMSGKVKNVREARTLRNKIAVLLTVKNEKEKS